jgi:aryl-alcohol dehydrogenase-like predicted oxidoreductase
MEYVTLGRTGLKVSVAGLGCGGHSRLGQAQGASAEHSADIIRAALDMGVNFIDTARVYRTEPIVALALEGRRDQAIISTKSHSTIDYPGTTPMTGPQMMVRIEEALAALRTDYIDVFNVHGVYPEDIGRVHAELLPTLLRAKEQGKIRFLGITEHFRTDTKHEMIPPALDSGAWDVLMIGFNVLNPSARERVFARTLRDDIGVQCMFAVRRLNDPETMKVMLDKAASEGQIDLSALDLNDPLGFLRDYADSVIEAAYRFCRHEPGVNVVLTGTSKVAHLKENLASINKGPLAPEALAKLKALFGAVDSISGEAPMELPKA